MAHVTFPKPVRGTALLGSRQRRADRSAHEEREMQAAKKRDGNLCRFPCCEFRSKKLPIDPCHGIQHRGMGGNPDGSRTHRSLVISLCRGHHGLLDAGLIEVEPLTAKIFDGPCAYYAKHKETGHMEHVASETRIGVSVARS